MGQFCKKKMADDEGSFKGVPIHWTGLLDSKFTRKVSFPAQLQPPKVMVSPNLKL